MSEPVQIEGRAAPLRIENLDTDQIMPKQFLRGIDGAAHRGDVAAAQHGVPVLGDVQRSHVDP